MTSRPAASDIDEYISGFAPATQGVLEEVRAAIAEVAPDAQETISYAIPTFDLGRRHLVHFAGFAHHIGFYPGGGSALEAFAEELKPYKQGKGSVQFPLDQPMPLDLVRRMVRFRVDQETARKTRES